MARRLPLQRLLATVALVASVPGVSAAAPPGWNALSAPTPKAGGGLAGVSCASATFCVSVGYQSTPSSTMRTTSLVEVWDGETVRVQNNPTRDAIGVSCVSTTFCMEVGAHGDQHGYPTATAARWNGTQWSATTLPSLHPASLEAVSCWSRSGCIAVGSRLPNYSYARPLVERWDGSSWHLKTAPAATQWLNHLAGVSCTSATSCIAVGAAFLDAQGRNSQALAERWNGRSWQIVPTPTLNKTYQPTLMAVSCLTARDCVAVGGGSAEHSLIVRWNGSQFVRETPAAPQGQNLPPVLSGVSCPAANFCMATGMLPFSGLRAERWDGTHWSMLTLPSSGGTNDGYNPIGVSCPTPTTCLAAGSYIHNQTGHVVLDEWSGP